MNILTETVGGLIVLVWRYRHGIRAVHHELPGGVSDPEDAGPEQTAWREVLEETGYGEGMWAPLSTPSANPGIHANRTHSLLATGVVLVQEPAAEATEDLRVHPAIPDEVRRIL